MADPFLGEIKMFAGNFAPQGFQLCNGQLLPISQFAALFSLLGTQYGGNGTTTFALPDLRGRAPVHHGQGPGLSERVMGEIRGQETVTLDSHQLPAHSHAQMASTNTATSAFGPAGAPGQSAKTMLYGATPQRPMDASAVGTAGSGQAHDNLAPYTTLNFIIAAVGIFPSRQ
jgi:microcystin-dependent protein